MPDDARQRRNTHPPVGTGPVPVRNTRSGQTRGLSLQEATVPMLPDGHNTTQEGMHNPQGEQTTRLSALQHFELKQTSINLSGRTPSPAPAIPTALTHDA
ncbi:hypothetical protein [Prevotella dentasini]|uniref:hypothetical protein n=1 Tax=Prevotella dentasini TaxID=589537 RepID=UPI0011DC9CB9|nr:hypothetical protein [Prevotella dentasini]